MAKSGGGGGVYGGLPIREIEDGEGGGAGDVTCEPLLIDQSRFLPSGLSPSRTSSQKQSVLVSK